MNYDDLKKSGVNRIEVSDSLNAPLLQLNIKPNVNTILPESNDLIIYLDNSLTSVTNRRTITFTLNEPLRYFNNVRDEFILEPVLTGNKISMKAKVIRRIIMNEENLEINTSEEIEALMYQPIVLTEGENAISTNYANIEINLVYPKNADLIKYFLANTYTYGINNEDKFLTLDDLYFKDCFTKVDEDTINALFNKLTIKCMNSTNNNFSLDCDGNLNLEGSITSNQISVNNISSKNNKFSLDSNGNLVVNKITTTVPISTPGRLTFNDIYPLGSIYISVNSTNPSALFGGTWASFGTGRTLVGVDTSQTEFNTVKKTGGEKKHTLTVTEMPSHNHRFKAWAWGYARSGGQQSYCADQSMQYDNFEDNGNHIQNTGGGQGHNNLQPYITVYMWQRTA